MKSALELHAYYSQMFEAFTVLLPLDIKRDLEAFGMTSFLKEGEYQKYGEHLERLRGYLEKSKLDATRGQVVLEFLDNQERLNNLHLLFPECRGIIHENDRHDLKRRLYTLLNPNSPSPEADFFALGFDKRPIEEIERAAPPIQDTDTVDRISVLKNRLALLDELAEPKEPTPRPAPNAEGALGHIQNLLNKTKEINRKVVSPLPNPLPPLLWQEFKALAPAPQPLDTPTKRNPAPPPPETWDEFLPHFRRAMRLIDKDEFTEADSEHLTHLGQRLVKKLDDSSEKRPKATKLRLIEALRECLNEMPYAETKLTHKLAEFEKTPALYGERYPLIREAIAAAEDTLGGLIRLLEKYYPDTLAGHIRTTNGLLAIRELVLKYSPKYLSTLPPAPVAPPALRSNGPTTPDRRKKIRFCIGFSPEKADSVAHEIELIDENNNFDTALTCKGARLCGFYKQLQTEKRVQGSLENLRDYFAERYHIGPIPSKPNPKAHAAVDTAKETETALKRLFPS